MSDIKNKIRDVITLTDLADYLKVSRPTLYKLIDNYDKGIFDGLDKKHIELFNYINDNSPITKKHVLNFIVQNQIITVENENSESLSSLVGRYEYTGSIDEEKAELIKNILVSKNIGPFVSLVNRYCFLSSKTELSEEEQKEMLLYNYLKDIASKKEVVSSDVLLNYSLKKGGR